MDPSITSLGRLIVSKVFIAVACGMLLLSAAACQNREKDDASMSTSDNNAAEVKTASDACSHCPGNQTATASGTCPVCGMKVTKG
jgi:uncharacterized paraquat-inducible protein A